MSSDTSGQNQAFTQLIDWQQKFWKDWMGNASKGMEQMTSMWGGQAGSIPGLAEMQQNWMKAVQETMGGVKPGAPGLGPEVFGKVMDAGKVYQDLLGFWTRVMAPLSKTSMGGKITAENVKQIQDAWAKEYTSMLESLWGSMPDQEFQETAKSIHSAGETANAHAWEMLAPVFKNMERLPEIMEKMAKGEHGAALELSGIFHKNYEATIGRVLKTPSLGYSREIIETINQTIDAYVQFNVAMNEYQAMFVATGQRAGEKVFSKLGDFQGKDLTPETFREFYRVWWTVNEETYHELFITEDFVGMLQNVLGRGLRYQQMTDDLTAKIFTMLNIPTKDDMDEIYKALYDLRKEVRWQRRAIHELEQLAGVKVKMPLPHE